MSFIFILTIKNILSLILSRVNREFGGNGKSKSYACRLEVKVALHSEKNFPSVGMDYRMVGAQGLRPGLVWQFVRLMLGIWRNGEHRELGGCHSIGIKLRLDKKDL
jgi:hypothetical protein